MRVRPFRDADWNEWRRMTEGLFPGRREGYGRALLSAAEDWARGRGYQEMASDALIENMLSLKAHTASGYEVVERLVTFRKPLT